MVHALEDAQRMRVTSWCWRAQVVAESPSRIFVREPVRGGQPILSVAASVITGAVEIGRRHFLLVGQRLICRRRAVDQQTRM